MRVRFGIILSCVSSVSDLCPALVIAYRCQIITWANDTPRQWHIQYIPRNMHTVFPLLCFVVVIHWLIFPYPSGLLHWHCGNLTIAPVPAKQPWWIWINTSCEFIMNDCITTTKQSTTKPCAYFLGYTVYASSDLSVISTVYPKKYAHGFVVLCFVVVMQSFIMNSHEVFIHIHQGCFAGTGAIVRLPQCQWSKPDGYGKISQCITTTKHSKGKTVCIFLGINCNILHSSCKCVKSDGHLGSA